MTLLHRKNSNRDFAPGEMHKKILIVEDDVDISDALRDALEIFGYSVAIAGNGQEALDLLTSDDLPCLILLDLMMPVMNGSQFRSKQLADAKISHVPVVLITADNNAAVKAAHMGVAEGLAKPLNFSALMEVTQRYCDAGPP